MSFRRKAIVALEEAELVDGLANPEAGTVPATSPEVEAGNAALVEDVQEVEELNVAAEEAEADAEALQDVADIMQESVDKGEGLDEQSAEIAEVAIESICARLGFRASERTMPAMESFGAKGTRLGSTKLALENLGDRIKRTWEAIVNFVKQVWEKIKGFFAGLLKSRAALQKHIESLLTRAVEAKKGTGKPKEAKIKGGFVKAISVDGKANKATSIDIMQDSRKLLDLMGQIAPAFVVKGAATPEQLPEVTKKMAEGVQQHIVSGLSSKVTVANAKEGLEYHGHLVDTKAIGVKVADKDGATVLELDVGKAGKFALEADALDAAGSEEVLKKALDLVKSISQADKSEKDLNAASQAAIQMATKAATAFAKGESEDGKGSEEATKAVTALRSVANNISKVGLQFTTLAFQGAKAGSDYAQASLNNIKEEAAPKKEGGAE